MRRVSLIMLSLLAVAIAMPALADARVKQRFQDIYKLYVTNSQRGTNGYVQGISMSLDSMDAMVALCKSNDRRQRQAGAIGANAAAAAMRNNIAKTHPNKIDKKLEGHHDWYTKPDHDVKLVNQALAKVRSGVGWIKLAWNQLAGAYATIAGGCPSGSVNTGTLDTQKAGAVMFNTQAQRQFKAGHKLLLSLL